ncbi:MAG: hypothetical protein ACJ754_27475 [Pyrinomonadaceae bacterium]
MDLEMVFNELSMQTPAEDILTARDRMSGLIATMSSATRQGIRRSLRVHHGFHNALLAPNYPLARWRNDPEVDREARRFLTTLATKVPFLQDLTSTEIEEKHERSECKFGGVIAEGLGIAHLLEALAISLKSEERWDTSELLLQFELLDEDGLHEETINIVHASAEAHVLEHTPWINNRIRTGIRDGADLWDRRRELFPSLILCDDVSEQVQFLVAGNESLRQILKRLLELEDYSSNWNDGSFDPATLPSKATPESLPTLQKYGDAHTFICPDGIQRIFSWHVRFTPGPGRIYFFPDSATHTLIVGYIGRKLPTVTDPT